MNPMLFTDSSINFYMYFFVFSNIHFDMSYIISNTFFLIKLNMRISMPGDFLFITGGCSGIFCLCLRSCLIQYFRQYFLRSNRI
ncbi:hypothetical protein AD941_03265 [Gluconobacter albidus]|uniref:Uncharacterized protein n=1 Tax=Gluconobacter albidus TaxID=318683 RepID=A0AAW3R0B8_9PROT|nr:hypothetical protein AD941_03265 [Gluconobacter albidus]